VNPIREKVGQGRPAVGSWILSPSGLAAEVLGSAGFDFLLLDAQHGGVTWDNMLTVLQGMGGSPSQAIVRVGWNEPELIMRALDLGAGGVVIPMVSTPEEAARAAGATRCPPPATARSGRCAVPHRPRRPTRTCSAW
jgi:4-hydroxy-2-oxoheptanedioate aldolase